MPVSFDGGLSRIDLGLGNDLLLPLLESSQYHPRQIADHSPLSIDIRVGAVKSNTLWKFNPFWLSLIPDPDPIPELLTNFFRHNIDSTTIDIVWETTKAFLHGQFIKVVSHIKTSTKEWENSDEAQCSEARYVADPTDDTKSSWLAAQSMLMDLSLQLAENKRFFLQQNHFEEGEIQDIC